jgi:hypothetical protein
MASSQADANKGATKSYSWFQSHIAWFHPSTEGKAAWDMSWDKCSDDPKWRANKNRELQLPGNGAAMFTLSDTLGCADLAAALAAPDAATKWVAPKWLDMHQRFTKDVACGFSAADGTLASERCKLTCNTACERAAKKAHPKMLLEKKQLESLWGHGRRFVPARCYVMGAKAKVGSLGAKCMGEFTLVSPMAFHVHGGTGRKSNDRTALYKQFKSKEVITEEVAYLKTIGANQMSAYQNEAIIMEKSRSGKAPTPAFRSKTKRTIQAKVQKMLAAAKAQFSNTQYMYRDEQAGTWNVASKNAASGAWEPCMKVQSNATSPDEISGQWYVSIGSKLTPQPLAVEVGCSPGTEPLFGDKKELSLYSMLVNGDW